MPINTEQFEAYSRSNYDMHPPEGMQSYEDWLNSQAEQNPVSGDKEPNNYRHPFVQLLAEVAAQEQFPASPTKYFASLLCEKLGIRPEY